MPSVSPGEPGCAVRRPYERPGYVRNNPARAAASARAVASSATSARTAGGRATTTTSHATKRGSSGRMASRSLRRVRFRTTAPPIRRPTAKPTRGTSGASRAKWYRTNSDRVTRPPDLARSNSARDRKRCSRCTPQDGAFAPPQTGCAARCLTITIRCQARAVSRMRFVATWQATVRAAIPKPGENLGTTPDRLGREAAAALGAPAAQDRATRGCAHAFAEPVAAQSAAAVGLVGAFHRRSDLHSSGSGGWRRLSTLGRLPGANMLVKRH